MRAIPNLPWTALSPTVGVSGKPGQLHQVSASMPLDLAWRDNTRRRSWALAELTRYTVCPRAPKNTAIGNHDGPVGSTTTSRQTPGIAPTRAACSTSTKLARVGPPCAGTRSCRRPKAPARCGAGDPQVDADQPPIVHGASLLVVACSGRSDGRCWVTTTVPRWLRPTTAPTQVLQPAPAFG